MIALIGFRCTRSNAFSREVLIARFPIRNCENHGAYAHIHIHKKFSDRSNVLSWWFGARVTPLPIPNREVKPCSGDDTPYGEK